MRPRPAASHYVDGAPVEHCTQVKSVCVGMGPVDAPH